MGIFMSGLDVEKHLSNQTRNKDTMQHRELRSCCRSRSVVWNFQFQRGTPVNSLIIRGIIARKFDAET